MHEEKRKLVQAWFLKANSDLMTARILSSDPVPYLDTAIFHCQQCAEKAIKGFLFFHDTRFEKTHNIESLIDLAEPLEPRFGSWRIDAARLTPYAVRFRYPGIAMQPSRQEFDHALKAAEGIYQFVLSLVPSDCHPEETQQHNDSSESDATP